MSAPYAAPFVVKGYGLKEEDLNEIIIIQKLKDITQRFSKDIQAIQERFNSKTKIRILEFNEISGADGDRESHLWFAALIFGNRSIFFNHLYSNRDCCVLFLYAGQRFDNDILRKRILPHEFAHHFQFVTESFPCLVTRGCPKELLPQYAKCYEIGPEKGCVYVDGLFFDNNLITMMKDFTERIADHVCEEILLEKQFKEGMLQEYRTDRNHDSAKNLPPSAKAAIKYMRKLVLYDAAEWRAMLHIAYPNNHRINTMLNRDREWVLQLDPEFSKAQETFKRFYEVSSNTKLEYFKDAKNSIDYIKEALGLLNIEVRPYQEWQCTQVRLD